MHKFADSVTVFMHDATSCREIFNKLGLLEKMKTKTIQKQIKNKSKTNQM
jgi:hypothetical protein